VSRTLPIGRRTLATAGAYTAFAVLLALPQGWTAPAETPTGDWLVEKQWAIIRIVDCGGQLWGVVSWETYPSVDSKNSDPAKRSRPTLGMPILLGMKMSKPNEWSGHIYNSRDGHTYEANISLSAPGVLRVEGCVLGFLCGGEDWTRVTAQTTSLPKGAPMPWTTASAGVEQQICTGLLGTAGSAHERRLK